MSKMKRVLGLAGIVLLSVAMLFGCAQLFWDTTGQSGWYIRLNIGSPGSKAISVEEYDVTRVEVELFAPGESVPFYTLTWYAGDDPVSELIPVSEQGEYEIQVTHVGNDNGEPVEAEESATFNIKAMIITVIDIIPGCIGTIEIEPGTEGGPSAEEVNECALTVMTALWEAMAPLYEGSDEFPPGVAFDFSNFKDPDDGEPPFGGIVIVTFTDFSPSGSDVTINGDVAIDITFPPDLLGTFEEAISASLSVSCLAGETVDIDLTLSMFMEDAPYWNTLEWDGSIAVNGQEANVDQVMSAWKAMVIDATTSTDGTLTVHVTEMGVADGIMVYIGVMPEGANPEEWQTVMEADGGIELFGGAGFDTVQEVDSDADWIGAGGSSHDVYAWVDMNGNLEDGFNEPEPGIDKILADEPVTVEIDGNKDLYFKGSDFEVPPMP